ncbi:MAG: hypothetical protein KatS3mg110_2921 [Pirellulaceae bacterium]|nr:MAG: hypothetical protein KatS3mg110_2921 [Pirellulaceae bacterium]
MPRRWLGCVPRWGLMGLAMFCAAESMWLLSIAWVAAQQPAGTGYLPPLSMDARYEDKKVVRDLMTSYRRVISNATALDDPTRQVVQEYFQEYLIKSLTRPENFGNWQIERARWSSDLARSQGRSPQLHDFLADLLFRQMQPLVEQNHHPIIRVNAMLTIADLNRQERGSGVTIATPWEATLPYMRAQVQNPDQIDAVRIAALSGILRHVESYWVLNTQPAEDLVNGLTAEMLALVNDPPPASRSADVHAWIQARALDILGSLAGWKPQPSMFQAMQKILVDSKAPIWLRVRAAYALSRVRYGDLADADKLDWPAAASGLAGLLADACRQEYDWLEREREKLRTASSAGVPGVPGVPGEPGLAGGGAMGVPPPPGEPGLAGGGAVGLPPPPGEMDAGGGIGFPASGMGGMMPYGPFGSASLLGGLPKYKVDGARRRLLYELACIKAALDGPAPDAEVKGIKPLAGNHPAAGPVLQSIEKALADVEKAVTAKEPDVEAMLKTLRSRSQELEQLRPQNQAQPADSGNDSDVPSDIPPAVPGAGN